MVVELSWGYLHSNDVLSLCSACKFLLVICGPRVESTFTFKSYVPLLPLPLPLLLSLSLPLFPLIVNLRLPHMKVWTPTRLIATDSTPIPSQVTHLSFKLDLTSQMPNIRHLLSLTHLTFGSAFNKPLHLSLRSLPHITHLVFGDNFTYRVPTLPLSRSSLLEPTIINLPLNYLPISPILHSD